VVSRDEIIDAVWGDRPPASAVNGVHLYIGALRQALEPERGRHGASRLLVSLYPGPHISAPAAASLAGIPVQEVGSLLAELARAHLIDQPSPDRFAVHDLLRAYAAELAQTRDSEADRVAYGVIASAAASKNCSSRRIARRYVPRPRSMSTRYRSRRPSRVAASASNCGSA
jgi:hypothetical protein